MKIFGGSLLQRVRRKVGLLPPQGLAQRVLSQEAIFRVPELTPELISAISLISPQFNLSPTEEAREFWERDQNASCWGEYEALVSILSQYKPSRILEIGPGLGRSLAFFSKKLGWQNCDLHAYEGDGSRARYSMLGKRNNNTFCGSRSVLKYVLDYNDVKNVLIFDALRTSMRELPGPYDFIYSFYSVGFHWSLEHFIDDICYLMHEKSIAAFTVANEFKPFKKLDELHYRIFSWHTVWPARHGLVKTLVLGKQQLPDSSFERGQGISFRSYPWVRSAPPCSLL